MMRSSSARTPSAVAEFSKRITCLPTGTRRGRVDCTDLLPPNPQGYFIGRHAQLDLSPTPSGPRISHRRPGRRRAHPLLPTVTYFASDLLSRENHRLMGA